MEARGQLNFKIISLGFEPLIFKISQLIFIYFLRFKIKKINLSTKSRFHHQELSQSVASFEAKNAKV